MARRSRSGWSEDRCRSPRALEYCHPDRRRAGQGAPPRRHSPGLEAREHHADRVGREVAGFRPGHAVRTGQRRSPSTTRRAENSGGLTVGGHVHGHAAIQLSRAAGRKAGRCADGHLFVRRDRVRNDHGTTCVRGTSPARLISAILNGGSPSPSSSSYRTFRPPRPNAHPDASPRIPMSDGKPRTTCCFSCARSRPLPMRRRRQSRRPRVSGRQPERALWTTAVLAALGASLLWAGRGNVIAPLPATPAVSLPAVPGRRHEHLCRPRSAICRCRPMAGGLSTLPSRPTGRESSAFGRGVLARSARCQAPTARRRRSGRRTAGGLGSSPMAT